MKAASGIIHRAKAREPVKSMILPVLRIYERYHQLNKEWEDYMINFEEELAKFRPSEEISQNSDEAVHDKSTDLSDIMMEILKQMNETAKG